MTALSRYEVYTALYERAAAADASLGDVVRFLRMKYTPEPIPSCVVCGGPLTCGRMGGGSETWYCDGNIWEPIDPNEPHGGDKLVYDTDRYFLDDHYTASRIVLSSTIHGDPLVITVLDALEAFLPTVES